VDRLGAIDLGDVTPPDYRDYLRSPGRARNEPEVGAYSAALGRRVAVAAESGRFPLVLGGDCSIVLGGLLGSRWAAGGAVGLAYLDASADFATPAESLSGSIASMSLGFAVGRGDTPLARLGGEAPLVEEAAVVLLGRRDAAESRCGQAALATSSILDLPEAAILARDPAEAAAHSLERLTAEGLRGFWIHLDAEAFPPACRESAESRLECGGPQPLFSLLATLVRHPRALGLDLSMYDPALDPSHAGAARLVGLLERLLAPGMQGWFSLMSAEVKA
jgi:arginase